MTEPAAIPAAAAAKPATVAVTDDNHDWHSVVVYDFEDGGIVYYADQNGIIYDTEDVYFGAKPARIIGRRVDGKFVPIKSKTSASPVSTSSTTSAT